MSKKIYRSRFGNKVYLQVLISEDVYKKLINVIPKVYGYYRGALSDAVEDALKLWIAEHTSVHVKVNPRPSIDDAFKTVINQAKIETDFSVPRVVKYEVLLGWIMRGLKIKERSAKSWIFQFMQMGLIKPMQPVKIEKSTQVNRCKIWELIYT